MKPIYSMSSVGGCSRVLGAIRLHYEPTPMTNSDINRLKHYTRCETLAALEMTDMGLQIEAGGLCPKCNRGGIHVEIDTPLFVLIGHLDRRLVLNSNRFPVEIKSLGKSSWTRFARNQFEAFSDYAGQEVCYLEAEQAPGIYWVMERDSGEPLKYIVNDFNNEIPLDGFERITLPVNFDQIVDKLNLVEVAVQSGELPDAEESDSCYFCHFNYLCIKPEPIGIKVETLPSLVEAADLYKSGMQMEKDGKTLKDSGRDVLLAHAKQGNIDKYRVSNVSFTYSGQQVKETIDKKIVKASLQELVSKYNLPVIPDEIIRLATKVSEPYDSYTIRLIKE